jgi:hypothetical protein
MAQPDKCLEPKRFQPSTRHSLQSRRPPPRSAAQRYLPALVAGHCVQLAVDDCAPGTPDGLLATGASNPDCGLPSVSGQNAGSLDSRDPGPVCPFARPAFARSDTRVPSSTVGWEPADGVGTFFHSTGIDVFPSPPLSPHRLKPVVCVRLSVALPAVGQNGEQVRSDLRRGQFS